VILKVTETYHKAITKCLDLLLEASPEMKGRKKSVGKLSLHLEIENRTLPEVTVVEPILNSQGDYISPVYRSSEWEPDSFARTLTAQWRDTRWRQTPLPRLAHGASNLPLYERSLAVGLLHGSHVLSAFSVQIEPFYWRHFVKHR
jgi:hypothetical protein